MEIINLDPEIIYICHKLNNFHSDPADQFIAATSIYKKIPLISFHRKLIEYNGVENYRFMKSNLRSNNSNFFNACRRIEYAKGIYK